ncbi:MAG: hypothetical protein K2W95_34660 [Candidatus Obscuribacterales bacterium]|nr:hypothetical protein [Candidatus Obscuribacterales bacterium]
MPLFDDNATDKTVDSNKLKDDARRGLSEEANLATRPVSPGGRTTTDAASGLLPVIDLDSTPVTPPTDRKEAAARSASATAYGVNSDVAYNFERWIAKGVQCDKVLIQQPGRGQSLVSEAIVIEGAPDPKLYRELVPFDGQTANSRYFQDSNGRVFKLEAFGGSKQILSEEHQLRVVSPADLRSAAPSGVERRAPAPAENSSDFRVGQSVEFRGEQLEVVGLVSGRAVLYKEGRNADYAMHPFAVTEAELSADYRRVQLNISGREQTFYVSKGSSPAVYYLFGGGGPKTLSQVHSFEVVETAQAHDHVRPNQSRFQRAGVELYGPSALGIVVPDSPHRSSSAEQSRWQRAGAEGYGPSDQGIVVPDSSHRRSSADLAAEPTAETAQTSPRNRPPRQGDTEVVNNAGGAERPEDRAGAAELRTGRMRVGEMVPAQERVRRIDGAEMRVRTPVNGNLREFREVEINGRTVKLSETGGWFYSRRTRTGEHTSQDVKLHITGTGTADLGRLQTALLPMLEDMRMTGHVELYKTFDPNFGVDGNWSAPGSPTQGPRPGEVGQSSKAFTIYVAPEHAEFVRTKIDRFLVEQGLMLHHFSNDNVGEHTRKQSDSQRVSIERAMWLGSADSTKPGAILDMQLTQRLHQRYSHGMQPNEQLAPDVLRLIERKAGIQAGQLCYDNAGRLIFADANPKSQNWNRGRYYVSEASAITRPGSRTGRPALYALYTAEGLDPARIYLENTRIQTPVETRSARVLRSPAALRSVEAVVGADGVIERRELTAGIPQPGEVHRERLSNQEIAAMREQAERLANSSRQEDRRTADALRNTADMLEGKFGPEVQVAAHRGMIAETAQRLSASERGGQVRGIAGGAIGVAILASAAVAYYRSTRTTQQQRQLERARVK